MGEGGGGWNILKNLIESRGARGYFIWYAKIEYIEADVFWIPITFQKQQILESNAFS